jgi:hypothetical protein
MPEKIEHLNEGTSFKDAVDDLKSAVKNEKFREPSIIDDLDELEKKIDQVNKNISLPLTTEQKINMLNQIFPIHLGDRVRNKHSEDGIVESVSIDPRGVLYLVGYKEHETHWEREDQIKKISSYSASDKDFTPSLFKTDIPDTKLPKPDPDLSDRY